MSIGIAFVALYVRGLGGFDKDFLCRAVRLPYDIEAFGHGRHRLA